MMFKMRNPEIKYIPVRVYVKHLSEKTNKYAKWIGSTNQPVGTSIFSPKF